VEEVDRVDLCFSTNKKRASTPLKTTKGRGREGDSVISTMVSRDLNRKLRLDETPN